MVPAPSPHANPEPEPRAAAPEHTAGVRRALLALHGELEAARRALDRLEDAMAATAPAAATAALGPGGDGAAPCPPAHGSDTPLTGP